MLSNDLDLNLIFRIVVRRKEDEIWNQTQIPWDTIRQYENWD
jgi:hypothetical protein